MRLRLYLALAGCVGTLSMATSVYICPSTAYAQEPNVEILQESAPKSAADSHRARHRVKPLRNVATSNAIAERASGLTTPLTTPIPAQILTTPKGFTTFSSPAVSPPPDIITIQHDPRIHFHFDESGKLSAIPVFDPDHPHEGMAANRGTMNYLRRGPSRKDPIIMKMPQGTLFRIVAFQDVGTKGGYYNVILEDGTSGWTAATNVRTLN